ncbi:MAG: sulfatase-like hydrolase/transferase [Candidatus Latescibacteria bacterium]|nr:sulfatase-like hydrolase/transferase [Candidatus Latescibacterota bacterium]
MGQQVLLFVIDGLRPDGLQQADTPCIDGLIARGASTLAARTVMPSATLPCHTSMFRGVTPQRHGIITNTWVPQVRPVPSLVDVLHQAGKRTAFFYNWEQLRDLADPGSLDRSYYINNCYESDGDMELAQLTASTLRQWTPDFAFVYLGFTDVAGHDHGWMSSQYLSAIGQADRAIGVVLATVDWASTAVIVTSDHGGHERTHGTEMDEDMTIPWVISGAGIAAGRSLQEPVNIVDNPTTIAALMDVEPARDWAGQVVRQALDEGAQA